MPGICNQHSVKPLFLLICLAYHKDGCEVKREVVKMSGKRWPEKLKNKTTSQQWKLKELHLRYKPEGSTSLKCVLGSDEAEREKKRRKKKGACVT